MFDRGPQKIDKYRTMITDMDKAVGKLLAAIKDMGVERDTLVVFTSDNGPEEDAGCMPLWRVPGHPWKDWNNWNSLWTTVGLRGNKRFIYEGGLKRQPTRPPAPRIGAMWTGPRTVRHRRSV